MMMAGMICAQGQAFAQMRGSDSLIERLNAPSPSPEAAVSSPGASVLGPSVSEGGFLIVQGEGRASLQPDRAEFTAFVETAETTAKEALRTNSILMEQVLKKLKEMDIDGQDIQTVEFSVTPQWSTPQQGTAREEPPMIRGIRVSNGVQIRVRHLEQIGRVLDGVLQAGVNRISAVSMAVSEEGLLQESARRAAVANARKKAVLYAEEAGLALGEIVRLSEIPLGMPEPLSLENPRLMAVQNAFPVPIRAGEVTASSQIFVVWTVRPLSNQTKAPLLENRLQ